MLDLSSPDVLVLCKMPHCECEGWLPDGGGVGTNWATSVHGARRRSPRCFRLAKRTDAPIVSSPGSFGQCKLIPTMKRCCHFESRQSHQWSPGIEMCVKLHDVSWLTSLSIELSDRERRGLPWQQTSGCATSKLAPERGV